MIKQILIVARREVEYWIENNIGPSTKPWALISIWNSSELMTFKNITLLKNKECKDVISIKFADTKVELEGMNLFNDMDAHHILNFINSTNETEVEILIVHCAAGVSRSGAVGVFACRYLNLDEYNFRKINRYIAPNMYVLDVLNKVSGINDDYVKYWKDRLNSEENDGPLF